MRGPLPTRIVETASRCELCEYNLTGLTERRCPECGTPIRPGSLPLNCVGVEHIMATINVFAFQTWLLLLWASSASSIQPDDSVFVLGMLMPMQWVIALAGLIVGLHWLSKANRTWLALAGMAFPTFTAIFSLFPLIHR